MGLFEDLMNRFFGSPQEESQKPTVDATTGSPAEDEVADDQPKVKLAENSKLTPPFAPPMKERDDEVFNQIRQDLTKAMNVLKKDKKEADKNPKPEPEVVISEDEEKAIKETLAKELGIDSERLIVVASGNKSIEEFAQYAASVLKKYDRERRKTSSLLKMVEEVEQGSLVPGYTEIANRLFQNLDWKVLGYELNSISEICQEYIDEFYDRKEFFGTNLPAPMAARLMNLLISLHAHDDEHDDAMDKFASFFYMPDIEGENVDAIEVSKKYLDMMSIYRASSLTPDKVAAGYAVLGLNLADWYRTVHHYLPNLLGKISTLPDIEVMEWFKKTLKEPGTPINTVMDFSKNSLMEILTTMERYEKEDLMEFMGPETFVYGLFHMIANGEDHLNKFVEEYPIISLPEVDTEIAAIDKIFEHLQVNPNKDHDDIERGLEVTHASMHLAGLQAVLVTRWILYLAKYDPNWANIKSVVWPDLEDEDEEEVNG